MPNDEGARPASRTVRIVVGALFVGLVSLELGLSRASSSHMRGLPRIFQSRAAVLDERFEHRLLPNLTTYDAAGIAYTTNALGYRDREWGAPRPDAVPRAFEVAVLGDSVSYASGVPVEHGWPRRLEEELADRFPGRGALVRNFSVPAYKLPQLVRVYEDHVRPFRPDVVLLVLGPASIRQSPFDYRVFRWALPQREGPFHRLLARSAVYRALADGLEDISHATRERLRRGREPATPAAVRAALEREALADLERLRGLLEEDGGRLVLMASPILEEVLDPSIASERWPAWVRAHPGSTHLASAPALQAAMQELLAEMRAEGWQQKDVWSASRPPTADPTHAEQAVFLRRDPIHLSRYGHEVLAHALAAGLTDQGLIPKGLAR